MAINGDTMNATTIGFGTSTFTGVVTSIGGWTVSRADIDDTSLASTAVEYQPGDVTEYGEFEVEFYMDITAATKFVAMSVPETITITYPFNTASSGQATDAGTGYVKSITRPTIVKNATDSAMVTATIKWDGKTPPAFAAET